MTRVLIADDEPQLCSSVRMLLANEPDIKIVAEARDGDEAVRLASALQPDIVLMDIRMPGMDGIEATTRITSDQFASPEGKTIQVIALTTSNIHDDVYRTIVAGASGFLLKDSMPRDLASALKSVAAGDGWLAPQVTAKVFQMVLASHSPRSPAANWLDDLTPREREILFLIGHGLSNQEIVESLYISIATVKTHVNRIFHKLGVRDRQQATVVAYQSGLVQPGTDPPRAKTTNPRDEVSWCGKLRDRLR